MQNHEDVIKKQLTEELLSEGFNYISVYFIADFFAVILYVLLLWDKMSHHTIFIAWFIIMFIFNHFLRLIFVGIYNRHKKYGRIKNFVLWKYYFNFINIQSGCLWALGGLLFIYISDPLFRLIVFIYLTGLLSTALAKLMVFRASYIGYMLPICIVLLILSLFIVPNYRIILFCATLLYIFVSVFSVEYSRSHLIRSVTLKFRNTILLENLRRSEKNFRNIIDNAPIGTAIISPEGTYLHANRTFYNLLGYKDKELNQISVFKTTYPKDIKATESAMKKLLQGEVNIARTEQRYVRKDGNVIWTLVSVSLIRDEYDNPLHFISQVIDVTDRIKNEKRLAKLNEQTLATLGELQLLEHEEKQLNNLNSMLQLCITADEAYPRISIIACDLFSQLSGGLSIFNNSIHEIETVFQWGKNQILQIRFLPNDCFGIRKGGIYIVDDPNLSVPCNHYRSTPDGGYMILPLIVQNELIGVIHLLAAPKDVVSKHMQELALTFSNIVKLALANISLRETLRDLSLRDALTGLFNRRYLDETLTRELIRANREKNKLIVAMLDIDDFKKFNDNLGHDAGDEVLKLIGRILKLSFRDSDIPCRFGGEEFVIIMLNSDLKNALPRLEEFRVKLKNESLFFKGSLLPKITISIGIAEAPDDGAVSNDIIRAADEALYIAKKSGKDRIEVFHPKV